MSGTSWESEMPWERMLLRTYRMFQADIQMNAPKDRTLFNYKLVYWLCNTVEGPIKKIDNKILNFNFSFQKNSKRARIVLRKLKKTFEIRKPFAQKPKGRFLSWTSGCNLTYINDLFLKY